MGALLTSPTCPHACRGAWQESAPAMLGCSQLAFAVDMGDVDAPNPCTVEAKRKAMWPLRGQATEHKHGRDQPPRGAIQVHPSVLKSAGTYKPEGELAILKSAAPGYLKVRAWYIGGE